MASCSFKVWVRSRWTYRSFQQGVVCVVRWELKSHSAGLEAKARKQGSLRLEKQGLPEAEAVGCPLWACSAGPSVLLGKQKMAKTMLYPRASLQL